MLGPRRSHKICLSDRVQIHIFRVMGNRANLFTYPCTARFAGNDNLTAFLPKSIREKLCLHRFPCSFATFKHDKKSSFHIIHFNTLAYTSSSAGRRNSGIRNSKMHGSS